MSLRTATVSPPKVTPSEFEQSKLPLLVRDLTALRQYQRNHVSGLWLKIPTNASTQATGAGATDWNVDLTPGHVVVEGVKAAFDYQADWSFWDTTQLTGLDSGDTVVAALIAELIAGTPTLKKVIGTAATTASGLAVGPTEAQIVAALATATNPWIKLGEATINRTADTTVTQSQDNSQRPILGVDVDTAFGDYS
jgi:hypothetical protein